MGLTLSYPVDDVAIPMTKTFANADMPSTFNKTFKLKATYLLAMSLAIAASFQVQAGYELRVNIDGLPANTTPCYAPWGAAVASGSEVPAYTAETVAYGESCSSVATTLSCSKGVLTGTGTHQACSVLPGCSAPGSQVYNTAGTYTFTLPANCAVASLTAKVWGAGGKHSQFAWITPYTTGGAGGYATSTSGITATTPVTVHVGAGRGTNGNSEGQGGGASAVLADGVVLAVGGGGGGGGAGTPSTSNPGKAGGEACGLISGTTGATSVKSYGQWPTRLTYPVSLAAGGMSGYGSGGGARALQSGGANGASVGGGGGGYQGGASGDDTGPNGWGGCGGSNYASNGSTSAGSGVTPGNSGDSARLPNAGMPSYAGQVVLTWQ